VNKLNESKVSVDKISFIVTNHKKGDRMKNFIVFSAVIIGICMLAVGCSNLTDSTKDKSVNLEFTLYGMKVETNDPTANGTPTGKLGFGTARYRSIPMEKGQPFYVNESIGSIWGNATTTTIWIGRATEKSVLQYEAVPNTMISISGSSVSSSSTKVNVISAQVDSGVTSK
jgi:hypothetical protein